jgi:hypothetical protein
MRDEGRSGTTTDPRWLTAGGGAWKRGEDTAHSYAQLEEFVEAEEVAHEHNLRQRNQIAQNPGSIGTTALGNGGPHSVECDGVTVNVGGECNAQE